MIALYLTSCASPRRTSSCASRTSRRSATCSDSPGGGSSPVARGGRGRRRWRFRRLGRGCWPGGDTASEIRVTHRRLQPMHKTTMACHSRLDNLSWTSCSLTTPPPAVLPFRAGVAAAAIQGAWRTHRLRQQLKERLMQARQASLAGQCLVIKAYNLNYLHCHNVESNRYARSLAPVLVPLSWLLCAALRSVTTVSSASSSACTSSGPFSSATTTS